MKNIGIGPKKPYRSSSSFISFESLERPVSWAVCDHQTKKSVWLYRPRTTNLRYQTSNPNAALSFSCCLLILCLLGIVMRLQFGNVTFAYYLSSSKFIWFAQHGNSTNLRK